MMCSLRAVSGALGALLSLLLVGLPASADPILIASPTSIPLAQTVIALSVDPSGTAVGGVQVDLAALASGLTIVSVSAAAGFEASGPTMPSDQWIASFASTFSGNQIDPFLVGTVTVEGLTAGTPLVAMGFFLDSSLVLIDPPGNFTTDLATVVPEPTSASLLSLGILVIAGVRRERLNRVTSH